MFDERGPSFWELTRQALSSTEHGYDLLAPKFEYTPFRTPDEVLVPAVQTLAADKPIDAALDVCCGTGAAMVHLRPHCRKRLTGIDFSQGMLDEAQRILAGADGDVRPELVKGDVFNMDFDQEFDLAVSFGALGHIQAHEEDIFLDRIRAALVPGGRFAITTHGHPPKRSRAYIFSKLFNAGMRVRNLLLRPKFIMYYLNFMLPEVVELFERHGFSVTLKQGVFEPPFHPLQLLIAQRR